MTESKEEQYVSIKYQILAAFVVNVGCMGWGCSVGWTSPSLPLLRSDHSPLESGPVSVETSAWIGAVLSLGSLTGTLTYGILSNFIGSKRAMLLCAFPITIHWIIIYYAQEAWFLILARFLCGFSGGGFFICIPLFVAEISSDHIRGRLSSVMQISCYSGIVFGYTGGTFLDYYTLPLVLIVLPVVFFVAFIWLPNTPQYLVKSGDIRNAEKSLRFYRNIGESADSPKQLQLKNELEKFIQIAKHNKEAPPVQLSDFSSREVIRGMLVGPILMAVTQFSGTFTLTNYANTIFRASGSNLDPNVSSIIMGSIQVMGTICASSFIDRLGRKMLLLISSAGSACALFVTGTHSYLNMHGYEMAELNVLPVVSLSFFIFISAVGLTPVPYVLATEVLPPRIRRIGATFCVCSVSVYASIMLRYFPIMLATFELYGCMWFFASVSTAGFVFALLVVEETKGRNLDQLQISGATAVKATV